MVLQRWTALCLAVDNEWGGRESRQKAEALYQDVLAWFYDNTGEQALQVTARQFFFHTAVAKQQPSRLLCSACVKKGCWVPVNTF